ncbi:MAG: hypothetical protein C4K58_01635 [Flavobacteriaceae bacterium]|nr:MAG: hypothetical protein C4K58_01635 [Flavobacteriaceae bacterium]
MRLLSGPLFWWMKNRMHQIEIFKSYPFDVQQKQLHSILFKAKDTQFGKNHNFGQIDSLEKFRKEVPITTYENFHPYIEKALMGEKNVLWPGKTKWFSKSSGTTNAQSKFIPISVDSLEDCHYKGGKDMFTLYAMAYPDTDIFSHQNLRLGGSNVLDKKADVITGDLSSILIQNLPIWAELKNVPNKEISLMANWEEKMPAIISAVYNQDVGCLTGVPSWMLVLLSRLLKEKNAETLDALWPNLEVFFHGGINFSPYREIYKSLSSKELRFWEIYNASEGTFAIQDRAENSDLLLMLDYGIFYEFIPMDQFDLPNPKALSLEEVEIDKNYALVITTNGGLYRYLIGDTVKFTSLAPFRIRITGRTKHFINAFGEELIIDNAEQALEEACQKTKANLIDYTAAPIFMDQKSKGSHQWLIEFEKKPDNLESFTHFLDQKLQSLNSDYKAKRENNLTLETPRVVVAPKGLFHLWLEKKGKLGGQNKVPRLSNTREYIEEMLSLIKET